MSKITNDGLTWFACHIMATVGVKGLNWLQLPLWEEGCYNVTLVCSSLALFLTARAQKQHGLQVKQELSSPLHFKR